MRKKIDEIFIIVFFVVLTILILIKPSEACENFLPKSQLELIAKGVDLGDKVKFCKDLPEEECICYEGKDLRFIKIEKEKVEVPVYAKKHESTCKDNDSCWDLLNEYVKGEKCSKENGSDKENESDWEPIYNPNEMSVYCAKKIGEEIKETDKHILIEDADKKAEIIQAEIIKEQIAAQQEIEKEEARNRIKDFDKSKIKSIEDISSFLEDVSKVVK